jgi:asparagine synthase (glutamine-hydrolysing)
VKLARNDIACSRRVGLSPHSIDNAVAWWSVIESLPHLFPQLLSRPEYRYPYLDRDLINYLFAIPPEQLVKPGRRRYLMRRALKAIVPAQVLERRRKAFVLRGPLCALRLSSTKIDSLFEGSLISNQGLVQLTELQRALVSTTGGAEAQWWRPIFRALNFELWLQAGQTPLQRDKFAATTLPVSTQANGIRVPEVFP